VRGCTNKRRIVILCIASLRMAVWAAEACRTVPHVKSISLVYILALLLHHTSSINARIIDHPKMCISLSLRSPNDYCSYSSWITCQCWLKCGTRLVSPTACIGSLCLKLTAVLCVLSLCLARSGLHWPVCRDPCGFRYYEQMYKCHHINRTWNVRVVHNLLPHVRILTRYSETAALLKDKFWKLHIFALVLSIPHRVTPDGMLFRESSEKIG